MNNVSRICPQCSSNTPLDSRHCPQCGYDTQTGLPMQTQTNLPVLIGKAALPVLAGVASLALRLGWKLIRSRMAQDALHYGARKAASSIMNAAKAPPAAQPGTNVAAKAKRTIRIRSTWVVGDADGIRQQGASDHTIEFED